MTRHAPIVSSDQLTNRSVFPRGVPPPRTHRQRDHGVLAPNPKLRPAVTAPDKRERRLFRDATNGGQAAGGRYDPNKKPRPHDTSRTSLGQAHGPGRGGVSARVPALRRRQPAPWITPKPGPIRKVLTHLGEPLEPPPPVSPARGPPTDWGELVQAHDDRGPRARRHRPREAGRRRLADRVSGSFIARSRLPELSRSTGARGKKAKTGCKKQEIGWHRKQRVE